MSKNTEKKKKTITNKQLILECLPFNEEEYETIIKASVVIGKYCDLVQHEANLQQVVLTDENHKFFVANILSAFALYGAHNINLMELVLVGLTRSLLEMPKTGLEEIAAETS